MRSELVLHAWAVACACFCFDKVPGTAPQSFIYSRSGRAVGKADGRVAGRGAGDDADGAHTRRVDARELNLAHV